MVKEKIQKSAGGRRVGLLVRILLAVKRPIVRVGKQCRFRYHAWDQGGFRFFIQAMGMLIIVALVWASVGVSRAAYRKHQENQAADQAIESLAHSDYSTAWRNAERALALNPENARASRVCAEIGSLLHRPEELVLWQRAATLAPTTENQLMLARVALHCEGPPYSLTGEILGKLAGIGPTNATYQEIAARVALSGHQPAEAQVHLANACRLDPTNREYALNLAIFELNTITGDRKTPARARVESYVSDDRLRPVVLRTLARDTLAAGDLAAAQGYSTQLVALPEATLNDRLRNLDILRQLKSDSFSVALAAMEEQAEAGSAPIATVSDWLVAHGLAARNIEWLTSLPDDYLAARPPVESALARSYLQSSNWQAALDFTSHSDWGELDFLRLAVSSHAWSQLGMVTLAESNWAAAVTKAGYQFDALTNLLGLAEQWQLQPEAADLRQHVRQFGRPAPANDFDVDTFDTP